jgi:thiamine-monophosphate kinase
MSEFEFIERIRQQASRSYAKVPDLTLGIGDDAAAWREQAGRELLVTTDLLVEDIDFKLEYVVPRWLGHKALAVSLSDIAAMGAEPHAALLSLAIPQSAIRNPQSAIFWEQFFAGYFALAERYGVVLIGGDISATPQGLAIDSIVLGHCAAGKALKRSGARVGDGVFVTGRLGAAAAGLRLLLNGAQVNEAENSLQQSALRAHLRPEPRVEFGKQLGRQGLAHALIDVSDGLAQDLGHICAASRVSAVLDFDAVPVADEVMLIASEREAAFTLAVSGGEDFELLLTAQPDNEAVLRQLALACQLELRRIGEIIGVETQPAVLLRRGQQTQPLTARGYDHFAV